MRIDISEGKKIMTPKKTQLTINISKYFVIILLISYKNNILYVIFHYEISFIIMSKKKTQEF